MMDFRPIYPMTCSNPQLAVHFSHTQRTAVKRLVCINGVVLYIAKIIPILRIFRDAHDSDIVAVVFIGLSSDYEIEL